MRPCNADNSSPRRRRRSRRRPATLVAAQGTQKVSPSVKMLFDIYHAQIMDGDVCDTIKDNLQWIGHFHTAAVPGRHELDDTQELNYRFIAKTIADLGFTGYMAHEYRPTPGKDPLEVLRRTLDLMDV